MGVLFTVMKRYAILLTALTLLLAGASNALAKPEFQDLDVKEVNGEVVVNWTMLDESGCTGFYVERSNDGVTYTALHNEAIQPAGIGQSYEFVDRYVFKQTARTFTYRIRAVRSGGYDPVYSPQKTIQLTISGIQQTWGGLKAMFR